MDFCLVKKAGDPAKGEADVVDIILTTHDRGEADTSPLQIVSAAQVAYWRQIEINYLALLEQLAQVVR